MADITLKDQIACARRELAIRLKVYSRWVVHEQMPDSVAQREIAGMRAIVHTLEQLEAAQQHQLRLWHESNIA